MALLNEKPVAHALVVVTQRRVRDFRRGDLDNGDLRLTRAVDTCGGGVGGGGGTWSIEHRAWSVEHDGCDWVLGYRIRLVELKARVW